MTESRPILTLEYLEDTLGWLTTPYEQYAAMVQSHHEQLLRLLYPPTEDQEERDS